MSGSTSNSSFENLQIWQKSHKFVLEVYAMTKSFPDNERFGLTNQFRRAAVSIPANIAEGFAKRSAADKARFYNISQGSLNECRYYLILAHNLGYATTTTSHHSLLDEVGRMLNSYTSKLLTSNS